jgi:hypothetical protein
MCVEPDGERYQLAEEHGGVPERYQRGGLSADWRCGDLDFAGVNWCGARVTLAECWRIAGARFEGCSIAALKVWTA